MSKDQKEIKVKKVDKNGEPLQGVEFKLYLDSTMPDVDDTEYSTSLTDEDGIATFKVDNFYYGGYIKETKTLDKYILRNDEKDIIPFYKDNGVRFLGEMSPDKMKVTSINKDGKEKELDTNKNINQELQSLTNSGSTFNDNTNWLVFNDNGTEKLVAKKPLRYNITWNYLYNAGVIFGQEGIDDLINADFTNSYYKRLKDFGKEERTPKTYMPTYVTINGNKYIVRLMRGHNDNVEIIGNFSANLEYDMSLNELTKGSEWNRLLLPIIDPTGDNNGTGYNRGTNGRYGPRTKNYVENNMPTLANYSWWTDFGGNNNLSGYYRKNYGWDIYYSAGSWRWVQETVTNSSSYRGNISPERASAYAQFHGDKIYDDYNGWLPVLEKINN